MLDLQYESVSFEQRVKKRVFRVQRQLMRERVELPLLVILIMGVVEFYLTSGVYFVKDPLQVDVLNTGTYWSNTVFRYPLLMKLESTIGLTLRSVIIILLVFEILSICGYLIMWINSNEQKASGIVSKYTQLSLLFYRYGIVIFTYFIVQMNKAIAGSDVDSDLDQTLKINYSQQNSFHTDLDNVILIVLLNITNFFMLLISLPIIYLHINPLRKSNTSWSYNNRYNFINYLLYLVRAYIVAIDGLTTTFIFLSFVCQIFLFMMTSNNGAFTTETKMQRQFKNNLTCALHLSVFIFMATQNKTISYQVLIILMLFVLIKVFLDFSRYKYKEVYLPLCESKINQFYDFYFIFQQKCQSTRDKLKSSSKKSKFMQEVFEIHLTNCTSNNCILRHKLRDRLDDFQYCQKLITFLLQSKKFNSAQNHILNELWLLEIQAKSKIQIFERIKTLSIELQYIVQTVKNSKKNLQIRNQSKSKTQTIKTQQFYSQIETTLQSFSRFYAQIQKPVPEFQAIIQSGFQCKMNTFQLKNAYNQNLKTNTMTFKMLQIYSLFQVRYGVSEQVPSNDWIDKAQYLQKNQSQNSIQELFLPTIYVNSTTGIIQNSNSQASYFFKLSKFEFKLKPIRQIFQSNVKIDDLTELLSGNKSFYVIKCMIKKSNGQNVCSKVQIQEKTLDNHRVLVLSFLQQKLFHNKNIFLVDQQFRLTKSIRKNTHFKTLSTQIGIKNKKQTRNYRFSLYWQDIFQKIIKSEVQRLKKLKILKLRYHQAKGILLIIHLQPTIIKQDNLITVTAINDSSQISQNRLSVRNSVLNQNINNKKKKQSVFKFYYHQYNSHNENISSQTSSSYMSSNEVNHIKDELTQKSILQNVRDETLNSKNYYRLAIIGQVVNYGDPLNSLYLSSSRNFSTNYLINNIKQMIVKQKFLTTTFLNKGIKTYRLWKGNLYNIDLQDKQAYVQSIEGNQIQFNNQQTQKKKIKTQYLTSYLFLFIIISALGLSISIFYLFNDSISQFQTILVSYKKQMIMQSIFMSYNKVNAIFRDVKNGMYRQMNQNWQQDAVTSFNSIKRKRMIDLNLFSYKDLQFVYNNVSYNGNFNEIFDLYLSEAGNIVYNGDENLTKITSIQDISEKYINKYFATERQNHFSILLLKSDLINKNLSKSFYISLSILILILIVLIKLFYTVMIKLKQKLNFILLTSDYEAKIKFENSEKIRYIIGMIQKKFDVDISNLLVDKNSFHKRRKSKKAKFNNIKKFLRVAVIFIYFAIHVVYVSMCRSISSQNIQNSTEMFNLGRSLMRCYTRMVHTSNAAAYLGFIDPKQIEQARQGLQFMQEHRGKSAFGSRVDQMVEQYMFGNICENQNLSKTLFAGQVVTCEKATPTFLIQNPFQLGTLQYIRRMQYQLINNVTETYAVSGVYSTPFARLFNLLANQFYSQGQLRINEYIDQLSNENIILIILSLSYILFAAYFLWLESSLEKQIKIVTDFFKSAQEKRLFNVEKNQQVQQKQVLSKKKSRQFRASINGATQQMKNSLFEAVKQRKNTKPQQKNNMNQQIQLSSLNN